MAATATVAFRRRRELCAVIGMLLAWLAGVQVKRSAGRMLVDQKGERRERDQRDVERRPHLHEEGEVVRRAAPPASANRKRPRRESGEVRGSEIMKKAKISSEPLCELMQRDRERIAEPAGARAAAARRGCRGRTAPCRSGATPRAPGWRRSASSAANQIAGAPLARARSRHRSVPSSSTTMAKPAGFQMCLPSMRSTNFDSDGDGAGGGMQPRLVGAQQQAQRQAGDERRAPVDARQAPQPRAQRLRRKRAGDGQRAVKRPGAEIEPGDVDGEQRAERGDLVIARIRRPPFWQQGYAPGAGSGPRPRAKFNRQSGKTAATAGRSRDFCASAPAG